MGALIVARRGGVSLPLPRLSSLAPALPAVLVVVAAAVFCLRPAVDSDIGWHLRAGQLTLATHHVATTDPFSNSALGRPWVDNEWLWESAIAAIDAAAGMLALVGLHGGLVAAAVGLIYATLRLRATPPLLAGAGCIVAIFNLAPYADVRPGVIEIVCAALFLYLLERHRHSQDWRWLLALLPVELVWANCHGSYVVGFLLFGLYAVAELWDRRSWRVLPRLVAAGAGLLAVSMANPIGPRLLAFTVQASRLSFNRAMVSAWMAPDFGDPRMVLLLITVAMTIALPLLWPAARLARFEALVLLASTLLTLQSKEFMPLYGVAAAPLIGQMAQGILRRPPIWIPSRVQQVVFLVAIPVLALLPVRDLAPAAYQKAMDAQFPTAAAGYINEHKLAGPMWNDFDWGGYLLTALPQLPVFVDSRTEMYGDKFLKDYLRVTDGHEQPDAAMERYDIRLVLIRTGSVLAGELQREPAWSTVYSDEQATVLVRA
jgi:hypothetical protein